MRMMIGTMMAAALVGCEAQDSVALEHRSELNVQQARGVELDAEGVESNVGMYSTTCDVSVAFGGMIDDYDYGDGEEMVVDGEMTVTGNTYLVINPDGVGITTPDSYPQQVPYVHVGVLTGALYSDGYITITPVGAGCDVALHGADGSTSLTALGVACDEESSITADTDTGMTWVSTSSGVFQVFNGEVLRVSAMPNALLEWDATSGVVYAGIVGQGTVLAIEAGGFERWSTDLNGTITALTDMGVSGSAAVSILSGATGELIVIDGMSGQVTSDVPTPSAATALDVSTNGHVLALTLPTSVHFFDLISLD